MTFTRTDIKERMNSLEEDILFALYSTGKTFGAGTEQECLKRCKMLLSGLSDDSLNEIPRASFNCEFVAEHEEGLTIIIEELI